MLNVNMSAVASVIAIEYNGRMHPCLFAVAALWIASGQAAPAPQDAVFRVGTASAARGQLARGAIEVPAGADAALAIPVAVVHGARPGPVLAIVSGAHGTEYASIIAVEQLIQRLDANALSGTVIDRDSTIFLHGINFGLEAIW